MVVNRWQEHTGSPASSVPFSQITERARRSIVKLTSLVYEVGDGKTNSRPVNGAFKAVEKDLSVRVADLAAKSSSGRLSEEERAEYEQIVRLNDLLSVLKAPG